MLCFDFVKFCRASKNNKELSRINIFGIFSPFVFCLFFFFSILAFLSPPAPIHSFSLVSSLHLSPFFFQFWLFISHRLSFRHFLSSLHDIYPPHFLFSIIALHFLPTLLLSFSFTSSLHLSASLLFSNFISSFLSLSTFFFLRFLSTSMLLHTF